MVKCSYEVRGTFFLTRDASPRHRSIAVSVLYTRIKSNSLTMDGRSLNLEFPQTPGASEKLVLGNCNLLEMVFEHFEAGAVLDASHPEPLQLSTRQNLLSAALVSTSFLGPAMNVLWRHLHSLEPIFRLIKGLERDERGVYVRLQLATSSALVLDSPSL